MSELDEETVVNWAAGVRTRFDEARDRWMILGPERILVPEGPGADIARLVDGERTVADIADALLEEYDADRSLILGETLEFLGELAEKNYLDG